MQHNLILLIFIIFIIGMILMNYKIILNNKKSFNNFTNSQCCCTSDTIYKCNKESKSCICDYYDKSSFLCQKQY